MAPMSTFARDWSTQAAKALSHPGDLQVRRNWTGFMIFYDLNQQILLKTAEKNSTLLIIEGTISPLSPPTSTSWWFNTWESPTPSSQN